MHKRAIHPYLLYLIAFTTGAVVMILELTGARIIAPFVGGSLITWTSLIGIVLAFLSFGYVVGGKLVDRGPSFFFLSFIYLLISLSIAIIPVIDEVVLRNLLMTSPDIKSNSLVGCLILFSIPSFLLGITSPYLIRLRLTNLNNSGESVGIMYALSTAGSIFGTFFTGFYLFSTFGSSHVLFLIAVISLFISLLLAFYTKKRLIFVFIFISAAAILIMHRASESENPNSIVFETGYNKVSLLESDFLGKPALLMMSGNVLMSAMYLESEDLALDYTKFFRLISHFNPSSEKVLMLGGGGYSYPKDFLKSHPDSVIDVVEIDPDLTEIAYKHFRLPKSERINIYHEDARTYLNNNKEKYDAIIIDAFATSIAVPFQLTTKEFAEELNRSLTNDGIVIMNTISAIEGPDGKFLRSEYHTFKSVFPYVYVFPVTNITDGKYLQNVIIIASKENPELSSSNPEIEKYLSHRWQKEIDRDVKILTDNFAPVEQYEAEMYH